MWMQFSLRGNFKWLNILPDLIIAYNNRKHRTIHMKPKDVTKANETLVLTQYSSKSQPVKKQKFKFNDKIKASIRERIYT